MLISEPFNLTEEGAHDLHSLRQAPEESNQNFLQRIFEVTDGWNPLTTDNLNLKSLTRPELKHSLRHPAETNYSLQELMDYAASSDQDHKVPQV